MHPVATHPQNVKVLTFLAKARPGSAEVVPFDAVANPYDGCGCHPDIVARLWDEIGKALPVDCRCIVHGTPTLAHPEIGVILGIGMGTQYGLRLPGQPRIAAVKAGARTVNKWSDGSTTDISAELGQDWIFGAWLATELRWCNEAYMVAPDSA